MSVVVLRCELLDVLRSEVIEAPQMDFLGSGFLGVRIGVIVGVGKYRSRILLISLSSRLAMRSQI